MSLDPLRVQGDAPDPDVVYRNSVETCRRVSIEPVPRERARALIAEWSDALAPRRRTGGPVAATEH